MKRPSHASILGSAALVSVLLVGSPRAAPPRPEEVGDPRITSPEVVAHVRYLASEELQGRGSGTEGNDRAGEYLAERFRAAGLKPAGEHGTFFQTFPVFTGVEMGADNRVSIRRKENVTTLAAGEDFLPLGFSKNGFAYAPVVFAGYGISKPELGYDDYQGLDVKGKIVVVLRHTPDMDDTGKFGPYAQLTYKTMTAREKGAAAILLVTGPLGDHPVFFGEAPGHGNRPGPASRRVVPLGSASADAGIPAAIVHPRFVDRLLAPLDRTLKDLQVMIAHGKTQSFLVPDARIGVRIQVERRTAPTRNVIGLVEGSDPQLKNEVVVIGAHYDHLGTGGEGSLHNSSEPAIHHGADDNASGTAGLLELAHYFAAHREKLGRSVAFMGFSGEEIGLLGSLHWTKNPTIPLERVVTMINMDMIGRMANDSVQVIGTGSSPAWSKLLEEVNAPHRLALKGNASTMSGFGGSDQQSFYARSIPVLFFFTGPHADYHRPSDTWEKVNAVGVEKIARLVADVTQRVSWMTPRPAFTRAKEEPRAASGGGGFRVYLGTIPDYSANVEGVALQGVREGSPAEKAGLREGDILVEFDGKTIRNVQEYTVVLGSAVPKKPVQLVVIRNKQRVKVSIIPAPR